MKLLNSIFLFVLFSGNGPIISIAQTMHEPANGTSTHTSSSKGSLPSRNLPAHQQESHLRLWYKHPAKHWMQQALPIGNGSIGAMIFGGVGKEQLQFNEKSLWSGKPMNVSNEGYRQKMDTIRQLLAAGHIPEANAMMKEAGGFSREHFGAYQPFGDVHIEFQHGDTASDYYRELDMSKALMTVTYLIGGVNYRREYFASYPDQVIVMRISADKPGQISIRVAMKSPQETSQAQVTDNQNIRLDGEMPESGMRFSSSLKLVPQGGKTSKTANGIEVRNANSVVLLLSAKTNYIMDWPSSLSSADPSPLAQKQVTLAAKKTYDQLFNAHLNDYQPLFDRVQLRVHSAIQFPSLPTDEALKAYTKANFEKAANGFDPALETLLFHYGRYLMIASSRKGTLPANLQGIWNDSKTPAWDSDYHTDINLEMNYWLNGPASLPECFSPFAEYVDLLRKSGRESAKTYFNAKGFFVNIYTNPWSYAAPRWPWTGAGGWLCQNLYDHFLFSGNETYLREKAYPIMREACLFYLDLLMPYADGSLVVVPGVSPEIDFRYTDGKSYRLSAGAAIDQQIVHDLFTNTIEAASILKTDTAFARILNDRLQRLSPPVKIGKNGALQEWIEDWPADDVQHRHISHLYALYPGRMIDETSHALWAEAASKSLALRGTNHTSWGSAWRIACYARLGEGDKAYDLFKTILRHTTATNIVYKNGGGAYENLLTCHSPFQIDGNFGFTAAVAEMLLQSQKGSWEQGHEIQLLPALPKAWASGNVKGLRARGGITVDIEWKDAMLVKATIASERNTIVTICYKKKKVQVNLRKGQLLFFDNDLNTIQ